MFKPYVAKDRVLNDMVFDFYIANETGKLWYDSSPNQFMPERRWCLEHLAPGMTAIDCGAHHGMMSVIFAKAVGPKGRVIAYEPSPANAKIISENAKLNGIDNIVVRPVGVGSSNTVAPFHSNLSNMIVSRGALAETPRKGFLSALGIGRKRRVKAADGEIEIVALDSDLPRGTRVDFLKIDVEGFEAEALDGMAKVISQRPLIDLEIHNFLSSSPLQDLAKLAAALHGYSFLALGESFGDVKDMGTMFDIEYLVQFQNPHVFCKPL
ncbi:MAG TPA: FkbM family methyltransferase [Rhizobiaceae bacterium]|nr:FkbM family methyltransferase [Rhizobiaceae bacterium]